MHNLIECYNQILLEHHAQTDWTEWAKTTKLDALLRELEASGDEKALHTKDELIEWLNGKFGNPSRINNFSKATSTLALLEILDKEGNEGIEEDKKLYHNIEAFLDSFYKYRAFKHI